MAKPQNRIPLPDELIQNIQEIRDCDRETAIRIYVERVIPLSWHHPWTHSNMGLKALHLVKCEADDSVYLTVELKYKDNILYAHYITILTYEDVLKAAVTYDLVELTIDMAPIDLPEGVTVERITNVCAQPYKNGSYRSSGHVTVDEWEPAEIFNKYAPGL